MPTTGREASEAAHPEAAQEEPPPVPDPSIYDVLSLGVLSRLAPGERLLSSAVSRGWHGAVCEPSLWASVDLTREAASHHVVSDVLLAAVVTKAAGRMTSLRLCPFWGGVSTAAALTAVQANAGARRHLDLRSTPLHAARQDEDCLYLVKDEVDNVLHSATGLLSFEADVKCCFKDARTLLAGHGQYSVVRLRRLFVDEGGPRPADYQPAEGTQLAHDIRLHPSLQELGMERFSLHNAADLGAIVDAAIACGLTGFSFVDCVFGPNAQSATQFIRLLRDAPHLLTLLIEDLSNGGSACLFDAIHGPTLAAALRASSLTVLRLVDVGVSDFWWDGVGKVLIEALVGHQTLQELSLEENTLQHYNRQKGVGACLGQLVTANSPSLHTLSLTYNDADEYLMKPNFAGLASNTFLHTLLLDNNDFSQHFAHQVVLRSVRANSALRKIVLVGSEDVPKLREAEALVAARHYKWLHDTQLFSEIYHSRSRTFTHL